MANLMFDSSRSRVCSLWSARPFAASVVTPVLPTKLVAASIAKGLVAALRVQLGDRKRTVGAFRAFGPLRRHRLAILGGGLRVLRALGAFATGRDTQCPALLVDALVQREGLGDAIAVLEENVTDALANQGGGVADDTHALDVVVAVVQ